MSLQKLRNQRRELSRKIKQEKARRRARRRSLRRRQRELNGGFLGSLSKKIDYVYLSVCERFESKAESLRYKMNDPKNYEADRVLDDVEKTLSCFEKKVKKGKELSERDTEVLQKLLVATSTILDKDLGSSRTHAEQLKEDIIAILPNGEEVKLADSMIQHMEIMLEKAKQLETA